MEQHHASGVYAICVQPGNQVETTIGWRTVKAVRHEHFATGGLAVIISFTTGLAALRVHAAHLLSVKRRA
ncbi:hypothetical protein NKH77_16460 [Streptomyces sp. M19]